MERRTRERGEAIDWAGYPVIARMSFGDAWAVYSAMLASALVMKWPWQARKRDRLVSDADWLLAGALYEAELAAADHVELRVYPQRQEPFATLWAHEQAKRAEFWRTATEDDFEFEPNEWERRRDVADRAGGFQLDFAKRLAVAQARWSAVRMEDGFYVLPASRAGATRLRTGSACRCTTG